MMRITVNRLPNRFYPDFKRVIIRFHDLGAQRTRDLMLKVIEMDEVIARQTLMQTLREFSKRHRNLTRKFKHHYREALKIVGETLPELDEISEDKKLLIGSYFSMEYAISSAAFFNPSIVESPDQTGLEEGSKRVIISFRATGEGHISSIVFHTGVIDRNGALSFEQTGHYVDEPEVVKRHTYDKALIETKLREMGVEGEIVRAVMQPLKETFIYGELLGSALEVLARPSLSEEERRDVDHIVWVADSHYRIEFSRDTHISERVIFPISYTERRGIEDARFVRFTDDDGKVIYYATYTAYDGYTVLPKMIVTENFYSFEVKPLHGRGTQNKNLALFPRKIRGQYAMLSRIDGINSYIGFSDNINLWQQPVKIQEPKYPWEFIQTGNCGAPIETPEGWLVITHGVGPMRQYCLGAALLDLYDPTKEIGRLKEPLLAPNEEEREGYVPNVVYSCGSILHNNHLIVPYGLSDTGAGFMSIDIRELIGKILNS
ncbi:MULTISPECIES: glycoside hydrolase family 130 protein [Proteiniphilum]|nr:MULTISPECIES: glycoside hydrolase family 130 protein [Proteiniphilum]ULB33928.1 glycoside hydrolase family 130 protein [Proteiniphilum propionicum]